MAEIEYTTLGPRPPPSSHPVSWRPPWLRRRVFATYTAIFVIIVALDGGLYGYSSRTDGLAYARQSNEWLWRFGPVAILTALAAFWARVEFQAMVYQPWINVLKFQNEDDSNYYLDYTDMILPVAVFNSAKNGHFLVLLTLLVGIFLKVQIILAPALFHLRAVEMPVEIPLTVHDAFVDPPGIEEILDPRPYYIVHGVSEYNHSLPFGVGSQFSYQTFSATDDGFDQLGESQAPIEAEVDALMVDLLCLPLDRCEPSVDKVENRSYTARYALNFDGCGGDSGSVEVVAMESRLGKPGDVTTAWRRFENFPGAVDGTDYTCDSITKTNHPFAIARVQRRLLDTNTTDGIPDADVTCHGIICAPDTWITKVLVTDYGGANQSVRVLDGGDRRPLNGGKIGWFDYILGSSFPELAAPDLVQTATDLVFPLTWLAEMSLIPSDFESVEWDVLTDGLKDFYGALGPAVGHFRMKSAAPSEVEGRRLVQRDRLVVDGRIAVAIAGLSGAAFILAASLLFAFAPEPGLFQRDPATILGSAAYLTRLPQLLSKPFPKPTTRTTPPEGPEGPGPRYASRSDEDRGWGGAARYPPPLRPAIRLLFVTCLVGVVGALVALAIRSRRSENGIAVVDDGDSRHLYWTVIPALAMFLISAYVQSCNSQLRSLAIFSRLASSNTPATFLDVSLRDMISPLVIYRSVRMRFFNVALSEVLAVLATFLGIFASLLYTADTSPGVREIHVTQTDVFDSVELTKDDNVLFQNRVSLNSLLMARENGSIVYPRGTHDDLVFPSLDIGNAVVDTLTGNKSAVVTVTGLQLEQDCSYVSRSAIQFNITGDAPDTILMISQNRTCPSGNSSEQAYSSFGDNIQGDLVYLALTADPGMASCPEDNVRSTKPTTNRSYIWGAFNFSTRSFDNLRMVDCIYSFAEVDVELVLTGSDLKDLDTERPPRVIEGTARRPRRDINVPMFHKDSSVFGAVMPMPTLEDTAAQTLVLGDFKVLFKPFGSLPLATVADTSQAAADAILRDLNHNVRLTAAQLVNMESRLRVSELADSDRPPPVLMSIVQNDRKILTQNIVPTILIGSVLTLLALVHVWGLVSTCMMSRVRGGGDEKRSRVLLDFGIKERVPSDAWSIASISSLLRESNMTAVLPEEVFWLPTAEAKAFLAAMWCRMRWMGEQLEGGERYFTVALDYLSWMESVELKGPGRDDTDSTE